MARYEKTHRMVDLGILLIFPRYAKETVLTDTKTWEHATALDWDSYEESDRKAREKLTKDR